MACLRLAGRKIVHLVSGCAHVRELLAHAQVADARRIDLGVVRADEPTSVSGDADALHILLSNLIGNALRFTPAGGRVDVACGINGGRAFLEVADTGPGIPAAERERVFDRFYRRAASSETFGEDSGSYRHGGGSGLGLSIVRLIAERHGATVILDDAEAGGLLASVVFPLLPGLVTVQP